MKRAVGKTFFTEKGRLWREGLIVNYVEEGEWLYYNDSGKIEAKLTFLDGRVCGSYSEYFSSGQLKEQGKFVVVKEKNPKYRKDEKTVEYGNDKYLINSVKDGEWKYFHETGKLSKRELFDKGQLIKAEIL